MVAALTLAVPAGASAYSLNIVAGSSDTNASCSSGLCTASADGASLSVGTLQNALAGGDVTVQTNSSGVSSNIALSADVSSSGGHALTFDANGGAGAINIGASTVSPGGSVTFNGTVNLTVDSFTTDGDQIYDGPVALNNDATITAQAASHGVANIKFANTVDGTHALTANVPNGTVTLGGVVGGLNALDSLAIGGAATISNSVTTNGDQAYGGNVTLGADAHFTTTQGDGGNVVFDGSLTGAHAATIAADGATTFTGSVDVGSLDTSQSLTTDLPAGTVTTASGQTYAGQVVLSGNATLTGAPVTDASGTILLGTSTLTIASTGAASIGAAISGTSGGVTQGGPGTLQLSGTNGYSGPTTISHGTLQLGVAHAVPSSSALVLPNTTGAKFDLNNFADTLGGLSGGGSSGGDITLGGASLTVAGGGSYGGVISGSGNLIKGGSGTLTLSGKSGYTGATSVAGGTLGLGVASALPTNGSLAVSTGATFDLAGFAQQVATLTGAGTVTDGAAAATLTVADAQGDTFTGGLTGSLNLAQAGIGSLTLAGSDSYTGTTTVSAGTLILANPSALGSSNPTTVLAGAGLDIDAVDAGSGSQTISLNGGGVEGTGALTGTGTSRFEGTVSLQSPTSIGGTGTLTLVGPLLAAGQSLAKVGPGTLVLAPGVGSAGSPTTIDEGVLEVDRSLDAAVTLAGGTLAGTGTIGDLDQTQGTGIVSPGNGQQGLGVGSLDLSAATTVDAQIDSVSAVPLNATGNVSLAGATLNVTLGFTPAVGQSVTVVANAGGSAVSGTFAGLAEGQTVWLGGVPLTVSYHGGAGNDVTFTREKLGATVALRASAPSSTAGKPVTLTASVSATGSAPAAPSGAVAFSDGGASLGTGTLTNGIATLTTSKLPLGLQEITASYGGDGVFSVASSAPLAHTVTPGLAAPVLSGLAQSASRWREGRTHSTKRRPPLGTWFTFHVNVAASVGLTFTTQRRCGHRNCTATVGTMSVAAHQGATKVPFGGRFTRWLAPGKYTLYVVAKNAAGQSAKLSVTFTIVPG